MTHNIPRNDSRVSKPNETESFLRSATVCTASWSGEGVPTKWLGPGASTDNAAYSAMFLASDLFQTTCDDCISTFSTPEFYPEMKVAKPCLEWGSWDDQSNLRRSTRRSRNRGSSPTATFAISSPPPRRKPDSVLSPREEAINESQARWMNAARRKSAYIGATSSQNGRFQPSLER